MRRYLLNHRPFTPARFPRGTLLFGLAAVLLGLNVAGIRADEPSAARTKPPAASTKPRFDIPVWHPDARWELADEPFALDTNLHAHLDGPRRELMWVHPIRPCLRGGMEGGGRYVFMLYDKQRERYHEATSGATGDLDGPFSRARLYVSDYHEGRHERAWSPDGRFAYILAGSGEPRIRSLDFAEQMVRTLPVQGRAFACGESGKLYVVQAYKAEAIVVLSPGPEWKVLATVKLSGDVTLRGLGTSLAVDEKHGRLYGTTFGSKLWYVWYWDLNDGSLHGVLPNSKGKPDARQAGEAGPFQGTMLYNHGEIGWGPDDADRRFLYLTRVDDNNLYRLDLKREIISVFSVKQGRFVEKGRGDGSPLYMYQPHWFADGSFVGSLPWYGGEFPKIRYFKRIK